MRVLPGGGDFGGHVAHVPRGKELALLDVDRGPGFTCGQQKVRLAAQESRDLQHIAGVSGRGALARIVHIGQHGAAEFVANFRQDRQPRVQPQPARCAEGGPVRLVIAGLENEPRAGGRAGRGNPLGHRARMVQAFQLARAGYQGKRVRGPDLDIANSDGLDCAHGSGPLPRAPCFVAQGGTCPARIGPRPEHVAQKWFPVLRKKTCDTARLEWGA